MIFLDRITIKRQGRERNKEEGSLAYHDQFSMFNTLYCFVMWTAVIKERRLRGIHRLVGDLEEEAPEMVILCSSAFGVEGYLMFLLVQLIRLD